MTTSFNSVATLSEQELLDHFEALIVRDRQTTAELLVAIAEIDERKIWAKHGCSSMFTFCMERFHMSEQVTAKRLWSARTARRFPVILGMVESGELHLGAIHLLAGHLTAENYVGVLERAKRKSCREVERLIAELAPRADVPSRIRALPGHRGAGAHAGSLAMVMASEAASVSRTVAAASSDRASVPSNLGPVSADAASEDRDRAAGIADQQLSAGKEVGTGTDRRLARTSHPATAAKPIVPLSPRRYKIEITVDEATHDKLRSLQDLLGRSATGRDPAAIISRAIEVLLDRTLAQKAGCTDRPKLTSGQRADSVSLAAHAGASQRGARTQTIPMTVPCGQRTRTIAPAAQRGQRARTIPAAVRRDVWQRDCGRCCYVDAHGRRCAATNNVEFHHRTPFAAGGVHTSQNIELRCAAHNQYQADLDFGQPFMDVRRGNAAPTFQDRRRGEAAPALMGGTREDAGSGERRRH